MTANAARVVVDAQVHSSSELAAMKALLGRMDGSETRELLLDAGFSNDFALIEETVAKEISLLSPEQAETPRESAASTRIPLREFCYDEAGDFYVCPQGHRLLAGRRYAGSRPGERKQRRPYVQYVASASDCGGCPRRSECTRGAQRTLQRDEAQALKEGLRQVMAQPAAKRRFAYRKAMVESVFSQLRARTASVPAPGAARGAAGVQDSSDGVQPQSGGRLRAPGHCGGVFWPDQGALGGSAERLHGSLASGGSKPRANGMASLAPHAGTWWRQSADNRGFYNTPYN